MGQGQAMARRFRRALLALVVLLATQLACRPLVTIGWQEMAIFLLLAAIVVVPLLWRFFQWLSRWKTPPERPGRKDRRRE